jgi:hypothetical protein
MEVDHSSAQTARIRYRADEHREVGPAVARRLGQRTADQRFWLCVGDQRSASLLLVALTVNVFLLEIASLELQHRIADDLVKDRPYRWVIVFCASPTAEAIFN